MTIWVVGAGLSESTRAEALRDDPDFRRATTNVRLAASAVEKALAALAAPLSDAGSRVALVVATGHGELEPTAGFLQELGRTNVARPLLFQNSLHNTAAGFLALRLALVGPVTTVSDAMFSGEDAVDVARTLLDGDADIAVVVGVDTFPAVLSELLPSLYPDGFRPVDGAAAIILANEVGRRQFGRGAALAVETIERNFGTDSAGETPSQFFDADAIAVLAQAALAGAASTASPLVRRKPDGTSSSTTVRWDA